jgi:hypothetical protein
MPRSRKVNLERALASLNTTCPKCGKVITPVEMQRIDFQRMSVRRAGSGFALGVSAVVSNQIIASE